jgi:hypothetical protein
VTTTKVFEISFHSDTRTRWLHNDASVAELLEALGGSIATAHTSGPQPAVSVIYKGVRKQRAELTLTERQERLPVEERAGKGRGG